MQIVIFLLLAFFCALAFIQKMKKERVNAGLMDKVIRKLLSDYKVLREHTDEIGTNAFTIGYAKEKHRGHLQDDTEALAVCVLDEKGAPREACADLGMEVIETGGRYYYQFRVGLDEKISGAEMTAILSRVKEKLEARYPDDLVSIADAYITVVVDGRKLLDLLGDKGGAKAKRRKPHASAETRAVQKTEQTHANAYADEIPEALVPASQLAKQAPLNEMSETPAPMVQQSEGTSQIGRVNFGAKPLMFPQPVLIIGTYDADGVPNAMNAAWGITTDYAEITISLAEHKTTDNFAVRGAFTVSLATEDYVKACDYVGIVSGRNVPDKFERAGFHAVKSEFVDAPLIGELPMALECRVESFSDGILVGEIVNVCADESVITDGKIDIEKMRPISFDPMSNSYYGIGAKVGNAFKDGKDLNGK